MHAPADPSSPQLASFCFHTFVCVFASATKLMASELPVLSLNTTTSLSTGVKSFR
ncbi:hypothetical protein ACRRTK_000216 [Alexandromys fortis]